MFFLKNDKYKNAQVYVPNKNLKYNKKNKFEK